MPEFPEWGEHAADAWEMLRSDVDVKLPELEELMQAVESRGIIASGERGKQALKGNVVGLAFLKSLLANHEDLLKKPNGDAVKLVVRNVDAQLFPYLSALLPKDAETLNFIDYTARRVDENSEYLKKPPTDKVKCRFVMTLADDNIGPLSQQVTQRLEKIINKLRDAGWDGFSTRYWLMADLDPVVHFLGRAAWDPATTARNAHDSLFTVITEKQEVADRLWLAMQAIEKATEITDKNDIGFNFPVRGMLMKHHNNQPVPEWWGEVNELYTNAMVEIYRSHDASPPKAKRLLFYWGKRGEYVVEYLSVIKSVREAAIANAAGDSEKALEHYETAMENLYNAIDTLSDIVKDQGDRGLIAVLNKFAFEALNEAFEKALDAE
jgi:tetratricopeptide (TPR) repeat protein